MLKGNKAFFGRWDDEVLWKYVDEAMYATDDGAWVLKMPPLLEAVSLCLCSERFKVTDVTPALGRIH